MLFSNLVATLRADLETIRDDLGEFVTTVKTDTTAMLGLNEKNGGNLSGTNNGLKSKYLHWEEELWDNPELLCEDPQEENWQASAQVNDEETEMLLSGASSDIIPELYRELVPARTTHADFFKRLFYHRNKMNQAVRAKMQELVRGDAEEEETGWEDDDIDETPIAPKGNDTPQPQQDAIPENVSVDRVSVEEHQRLLKVKDDEIAEYKKELDGYKQIVAQLQAKVEDLAQKVKLGDDERVKLQHKIIELTAVQELPHKKTPVVDGLDKSSSTATLPTEAPSPSPTTIAQPLPAATPASITSWEALPTSPGSSSNEEPVVVMNTKQEDEEEDDWE
jgi:hypothetical protein